jgi:hypothetical protein
MGLTPGMFLVNTIVGDTDNAPLEVTLNWTAGLKK